MSSEEACAATQAPARAGHCGPARAGVPASDAEKLRSMDKRALAEMASSCLQLAAGNKITLANSWELPIIQYLPSLVEASELQEGSSMQSFVECTNVLGVAEKVFSKRVDQLHDATMAVAAVQDAEPGVEGSAENGRKGKTAKAKAAASEDDTLGKEQDIMQPPAANEGSWDPLYSFVTSDFTEGDVSSLLMNQLSFLGGADLEFRSEDAPGMLVAEATVTPAATGLRLSWMAPLLGPLKGGTGNLMPSLVEHLPKSDAQATEDMLKSVTAAAEDMREAIGRKAHASPRITPHVEARPPLLATTSTASTPDEPASAFTAPFGSGAAVLADADHSADFGDIGFGDAAESDDWVGFGDPDDPELAPLAPEADPDGELARNQKRMSEAQAAVDWLQKLSTDADVSTAGVAARTNKFWRFDQNDEEPAKKRAAGKRAPRKKADDWVASVQNMDASLPPAATAEEAPKTLLSAARMRKRKLPLLPKSHRLVVVAEQDVLLTPYWGQPYLHGTPTTDKDTGVEDERGGAGNDHADDEGYAGWFGAEDHWAGDGGDDENIGDEGDWGVPGAAAGPAPLGLDMLPMPANVQARKITYAKRAKQVDVLNLKQSVWRELSEAHCRQQSDSSAAAAGGNEEVRFEDVMHGIKAGDGCRLEDLSVHLVFICLLHLANERELVVKGTVALDSLLISSVAA